MRKLLLTCLLGLLLTAPAFSQSVPALGHVVVVAFENHSYSQVVGSSAMPYLNGLISQYALATGYYANTHPSIGNYFELTTGQIITNNDSYNTTVSVNNLERELLKAGKSWKSYAQSIPYTGYTGWDHYPYVKHHNPFAYFSDNVGSSQVYHLVPLAQFATDINNSTLPNFSLVIPDLHHDAHDCPAGMSTCTDSEMLNAADQFLQFNVAPVLNSAQFQKDGLLVIWWDEGKAGDTANGGGHVAITLVGPAVKRGYKSSTFYQHQNLLRTIAEALGSGLPGSSATAASMAEFFITSTSSGSGTIAGRVSDISTGSAIAGAKVSFSGGSTTSNSSGNYSFGSVAAGSYLVSAATPGYFTESGWATVTAGATSTVNIQLPTGGILAGTVTGSNGAALANATVTVTGGKVSTTKNMITGSSGTYNTSWVPVGTYTLSVAASGYSTQSRTATVNTGVTTTLNVAMPGSTTTSGAISGRVVDISSGAGISGAAVKYSGGSTTADGSGNFKFTNVAAGTYVVTASASGYFTESSTVSVTAGATSSTTVRLPTGGILKGTVTTTSGAALANASVTVTGGKVSTTKSMITSSTGAYSTSWVPVGSYTVAVNAAGYTPQTKTANVSTGATTTLNFSLSSSSTAPAHSVTAHWDGSPSSDSGYNIYRSGVSGGPYTRINSALDISTSYTDSTVLAGHTYFYVVTAVGLTGRESGYSSEVKAVIPTP